MEPFENNIPQPEYNDVQPESREPSAPQPEPQPTAYHGTGTGRKESPYADSPYVMNPQPRQEYSYQPQTEPPVKPKKVKKPRKKLWKGLLAGVLAVSLVAGSCAITAAVVSDYWEEREEVMFQQFERKFQDLQEQINQTPGSSRVPLPADGSVMTPAQLYASCVNSVVAISTKVQTNSYYGPTEGSSSGSGFILTEDGYVITNYHVVEGATAIEVITHDGTEYEARLIGNDSTNDLAVLKVEATGLPAAALGNSNDLLIGDMVVAIGNPLGELASTQTVGYVSGIDREVSTDNLTTISMIQTDAAINPGNSGGPLFNMYGQVIGITTAKYSGTTGSGASIEGIGFAIPIDDVVSLIDDLIDYGYVTGAYMGVSVQNTDEESAAMFGLPTGAYIVSVEKDGAAERAGIQPKDIVIGLGEYKVSNVTDLTRSLRNFKAGDTTTVTLIRGGRELTLEITLDEKPQNTPASTEPQTQIQPETQNPYPKEFEDMEEFFRRFFGN
ncbi:MAG: trypsin-like peptidase domain-containing protein [Oscillospiraceae bacterium]|nr:trypsin-like peptidase domain-containing protein [Oscillospiraceae bacterium]